MQVKETRVGEFTSLREFLCCFIAIHKVSPFIGSSNVIQSDEQRHKALTNLEPQKFF